VWRQIVRESDPNLLVLIRALGPDQCGERPQPLAGVAREELHGTPLWRRPPADREKRLPTVGPRGVDPGRREASRRARPLDATYALSLLRNPKTTARAGGGPTVLVSGLHRWDHCGQRARGVRPERRDALLPLQGRALRNPRPVGAILPSPPREPAGERGPRNHHLIKNKGTRGRPTVSPWRGELSGRLLGGPASSECATSGSRRPGPRAYAAVTGRHG
jgi:hypothetical protein